jgi:hypothetical protein
MYAVAFWGIGTAYLSGAGRNKNPLFLKEGAYSFYR